MNFKKKILKFKHTQKFLAYFGYLYISFVCLTSKIKIRGATAAETTSAGVLITYSNVNLSDKGAFSLSGSSKDTRAWFIGAASFLLLDIQTIPARCD